MRSPSPSVSVSGVSVHSGSPCRATLWTAPRGHGVVFRRAGVAIPADLTSVQGTAMQTVLGAGPVTVATVEHLLSACASLGRWDLLVEVDGDSLPILDGSAQPWVELLDELPAPASGSALRPWAVTTPVEARDGDRFARLEPGPAARVSATLTHSDHASLGPTHVGLTLHEESYREHVAPARTFVLARDVARLQAAGHGAGATVENTLLLTAEGLVNEGGARFPSEPVRHKILDALGDLALLGRPWVGRLVLQDSSHALHVALARAIRAQAEVAA